MKTREIPEIKEISKEEIHSIGLEVYSIQAILETLTLALYSLQGEPDPVTKAVTMSFVAGDAAKRCEAVKERLDDAEDKLN